MARLKPEDAELERVLIVAREQVKARLSIMGLNSEEDEIPDHVLDHCLVETLETLDYDSLMPNHIASLNNIKEELSGLLSKTMDDNSSMTDRVEAQSKMQSAIKEEPWKKNVMIDFRSALKDEMIEIRREFKARVKLGKRG